MRISLSAQMPEQNAKNPNLRIKLQEVSQEQDLRIEVPYVAGPTDWHPLLKLSWSSFFFRLQCPSDTKKKRPMEQLWQTVLLTQETPTTTQCSALVGDRKQTHPLTREHFVHLQKPSLSPIGYFHPQMLRHKLGSISCFIH